MTDAPHVHVTHKLDGLKLGPKLGPFPVAVWVLLIAAGLYVAHRRSVAAGATSSADTTATDTTSATDTSGAGAGSDVPASSSTDVPLGTDTSGGTSGGSVDPGGTSTSAGTSATATGLELADNVTWQASAISAAVKAGITPITASNAIGKFLAGDALTVEEAHAVNLAIETIGPPPEGAPPVRVKPTPSSSTPPPPRPTNTPKHPTPKTTKPRPAKSAPAPRPTAGQRVTVRAGDTLSAIAAAHHVSEPALYHKNLSTIESAARSHGKSSSDNGHWIFAGTVLVLP